MDADDDSAGHRDGIEILGAIKRQLEDPKQCLNGSRMLVSGPLVPALEEVPAGILILWRSRRSDLACQEGRLLESSLSSPNVQAQIPNLVGLILAVLGRNLPAMTHKAFLFA